jgi:hypothetical protein
MFGPYLADVRRRLVKYRVLEGGVGHMAIPFLPPLGWMGGVDPRFEFPPNPLPQKCGVLLLSLANVVIIFSF